jgi:hypothetical protein
MAKLCRACQKLVAERGGVCPACRRRVLRDPVSPTLRPGVWKLALVLVGMLTIASSLIAAAVVTHQMLPWHHQLKLEPRLSPTQAVTFETVMVVEQGTRKVYPYSIVPGGAENLEEARQAMRDPAVADHYTNIDFTQLKQVKLTTNLSGYVSYRWGDKIYWTSKALTLRAGETVFTDGVRMVRGRCLNRYSEHAMLPTRSNEPTEKVLDTPVEMPVIAYSFPKLPVATPQLPPPPEELTPTVPIFPPTPPLTPGKPGGGFWFPVVPIIPPIHRHPGHAPSTPTSPPPVNPPVAIVPEPRYGWVVAAGLLSMMLAYGLWRRAILRLPNLSSEKLQAGGISVVEP